MPDLDTQLRNLADHRAAQVPEHPVGATDGTDAETIEFEAPTERPKRGKGRILVAAAVITTILGMWTAMWLTTDGDTQTVLTPLPAVPIPERGIVERSDWARALDDLDTPSTFVVARVGGEEPIQAAVPSRALERFRPASTYKLVNALLFLEEGVVDDLFDDPIEWDGVDRGISAWNQDQTLSSAIQSSAVWAFERWSAELDPGVAAAFVDEIDYGNEAVGDASGTYWLDGDLEISAVEQLAFLEAMVAGELPVDVQNQANILGNITGGPELPAGGIRYKTGTALAEPEPVAWLVGFVKTGDATWVFALNADLPRDETGAPGPIPTEDRVDVVMELLRAAEIVE